MDVKKLAKIELSPEEFGIGFIDDMGLNWSQTKDIMDQFVLYLKEKGIQDELVVLDD